MTTPLSDGDDAKDDQLIFALLTSRTKEEEARESGMSHAMMHRAWLPDRVKAMT